RSTVLPSMYPPSGAAIVVARDRESAERSTSSGLKGMPAGEQAPRRRLRRELAFSLQGSVHEQLAPRTRAADPAARLGGPAPAAPPGRWPPLRRSRLGEADERGGHDGQLRRRRHSDAGGRDVPRDPR